MTGAEKRAKTPGCRRERGRLRPLRHTGKGDYSTDGSSKGRRITFKPHRGEVLFLKNIADGGVVGAEKGVCEKKREGFSVGSSYGVPLSLRGAEDAEDAGLFCVRSIYTDFGEKPYAGMKAGSRF